MSAARLACAAVAVMGVVLVGKAEALPQQALGLAIALMAMWMMLIVPKMLAHRWRTPPEQDAQ
jgi:membrane protein YdbS with pleckstrin-like domain